MPVARRRFRILFSIYCGNRAGPTTLRHTHPGGGKVIVPGVDWLTGNCWLFGLRGQNWMLLAGGGLLIYIGVLVFARYRQTRRRSTP
jgi:hypothetical protein